MTFRQQLLGELTEYVQKQENILDTLISQNYELLQYLTDEQLASLNSLRKYRAALLGKFPYSYDDLKLIIESGEFRDLDKLLIINDIMTIAESIFNSVKENN